MTLAAQKLVTNLLDGLSGMGDVSDRDVMDYITDSQKEYVNQTWKRYAPKAQK